MESSTYCGASHLHFEKLPLDIGKKLHTYMIINTSLNQRIGIIHWRGGWRQYVSQTYPKTDMSRSCNKEVNKFIDKLMDEWKQRRKK